MSSRRQAAVVQLAAFLLGAIVGPVCHLARHRADHAHGPAGAPLALPVDLDDHAAWPHDPSRLPGEPLEGVEDIHTHPTPPRTLRIGLVASF